MRIPKKLLVVIMMVLAVALFSGKAFAQAIIVHPNPASVGDFICNVVLPGGLDTFSCDPEIKGNSKHTTITPKGMIIMKCSCALPIGVDPPLKTEMDEGFDCLTPFQVAPTSDSRYVITKGGRSNLTCTHPAP